MRRQLTLVAAATTAMVVLAFVVPLASLVRTLAEERAMVAAEQVASLMAVALADSNPDTVTTAVALGPVADAGVATVLLADGTMVGDRGIHADDVARARAGEGFRKEVPGGVAVVTPIGGPGDISVVQVVVPDARLRAGVAESWAVIGALAAVLVGGAMLLADRLARRVTAPMDDVATAARSLSAGDTAVRAPVSGPAEVADVANALNALADSIADMLVAEREIAADLSHRLRTPMTALRLDIEALGDAAGAGRLAADLAAMEAAVDRLIRSARAGRPIRGPTDLAALVVERLAFWAPLAEDEGRDVTVATGTGPVEVEVAADELAAAVDALVVNVLTHTPPGTPFEVVVDQVAGEARLVVRDHGPGLPDHGVLARGRSGQGSTGLGLDICRRLAQEADGRLELSSGRDATAGDAEAGATVTLSLPVRSPR